MNNLSGHLNFTSSDTHFGRNKRKKDTVSDANGNGFEALHLNKKRCLGISSYPNDQNNHVNINDIDMSDTSHANASFQVGASNGNCINSSTSCSSTSLQHKQERHEVRSFCRPHWKEDFYEFGPFF